MFAWRQPLQSRAFGFKRGILRSVRADRYCRKSTAEAISTFRKLPPASACWTTTSGNFFGPGTSSGGGKPPTRSWAVQSKSRCSADIRRFAGDLNQAFCNTGILRRGRCQRPRRQTRARNSRSHDLPPSRSMRCWCKEPRRAPLKIALPEVQENLASPTRCLWPEHVCVEDDRIKVFGSLLSTRAGIRQYVSAVMLVDYTNSAAHAGGRTGVADCAHQSRTDLIAFREVGGASILRE
jgi:hypothetical protein